MCSRIHRASHTTDRGECRDVERVRGRERERSKRRGRGVSLLETEKKKTQTLKQSHYVKRTLLMAAFLHLCGFRTQMPVLSFFLRIHFIIRIVFPPFADPKKQDGKKVCMYASVRMAQTESVLG